MVFEASAETIRTFDQLSASFKARWEEVKVMDEKPRLQFIGTELATVTFRMDFRTPLIPDPADELKTLQKMLEAGEPKQFQLGGRPLSNHPWALLGYKVDFRKVDGQGFVLSAGVTVNLQEAPQARTLKEPQ